MGQEQSRLVEEQIADEVEAKLDVPQFPTFEIPHADRVITAFGVTGAIGSLINFCPVPEEDKALWTQEKVDSWVDHLIAMDESEVEPEDEDSETEDSGPEKAKKKLN